MERNEVLKSIGFSDVFLSALSEFEKAVPNVNYELPFNEEIQSIVVEDSSNNLINL